MKKIISLLLVVLMLTGCGATKEKDKDVVTDATKFKKEYTKVTAKNPFVYATANEIIQIIEKGTGVIFFGMSQDLWSQAVAPIIEEVAKENKITKVYYYNPREIQINNTAEYQKMVVLLKDYLKTDDKGKSIIKYPAVYVIDKGKVIGDHIIIHDGKAQVVNLNEDEIAAIKKPYSNIMSKLKK